MTLKKAVLGDFTPDLTLYLDVEPEIGLARARSRGELDRIEQQQIDFFQRTRQRYLQLVNDDEKSITINANLDFSKVNEQLRKAITQWFQQQK